MDYIHDNKTGWQCATELAWTQAPFFLALLGLNLYFYFVSKSYYLEEADRLPDPAGKRRGRKKRTRAVVEVIELVSHSPPEEQQDEQE